MKSTFALVLSALFLAGPAFAQLPDAPKPLKAFAVNVGLSERYSLTKSLHELSPQVGIDYRIVPRLRVGIGYSHTIVVNPANGPRQGNSILVGLNYKLFEWGKAR